MNDITDVTQWHHHNDCHYNARPPWSNANCSCGCVWLKMCGVSFQLENYRDIETMRYGANIVIFDTTYCANTTGFTATQLRQNDVRWGEILVKWRHKPTARQLTDRWVFDSRGRHVVRVDWQSMINNWFSPSQVTTAVLLMISEHELHGDRTERQEQCRKCQVLQQTDAKPFHPHWPHNTISMQLATCASTHIYEETTVLKVQRGGVEWPYLSDTHGRCRQTVGRVSWQRRHVTGYMTVALMIS